MRAEREMGTTPSQLSLINDSEFAGSLKELEVYALLKETPKRTWTDSVIQRLRIHRKDVNKHPNMTHGHESSSDNEHDSLFPTPQRSDLRTFTNTSFHPHNVARTIENNLNNPNPTGIATPTSLQNLRLQTSSIPYSINSPFSQSNVNRPSYTPDAIQSVEDTGNIRKRTAEEDREHFKKSRTQEPLNSQDAKNYSRVRQALNSEIIPDAELLDATINGIKYLEEKASDYRLRQETPVREEEGENIYENYLLVKDKIPSGFRAPVKISIDKIYTPKH
jgi:hypothetical protein